MVKVNRMRALLLFFSFLILTVDNKIDIGSNVITDEKSAIIKVESENECCCSMQLRIYNTDTILQNDCGGNNDCVSCKTFPINDLLPNRKYIMTYTLPNSTFIPVYFSTKPLEPKFDLKYTSTTVTLMIPYNASLNITDCKFLLKNDDNKILDSCVSNCDRCDYYKYYKLEQSKIYKLYYNNSYLSKVFEETFTTKSSIINVKISPLYTSVTFKITSIISKPNNCDAIIMEYPSSQTDFNCQNNLACSSCRDFKVSGLKPNNKYILTYYFNSRQEIKDIYFETYNMLISQSFHQDRVTEMFVLVSIYDVVPALHKCTIEITPKHATCKPPCKTDCSNYKILLSSRESFTVNLSSPDAAYSSIRTVRQGVLRFRISKHYINGHIVYVSFEPNMKLAGECNVEVFNQNKKIDAKCLSGLCPTDCDHLDFAYTGIDIDINVTFKISNKYLVQTQELELNLVSDVSIEEEIVPGVDHANVIVYHGNICCCNATLHYYYTNTLVSNDCFDNEGCKRCYSFKIANLTSNSRYLLRFYSPDGRMFERDFKTKTETVEITYKSGPTDISFTINGDVPTNKTQCRMSLSYNGTIYHDCSEDCDSCDYMRYYSLKPDTEYTFNFKSVFMQKNLIIQARTGKEQFKKNATITATYDQANISLWHDSKIEETCQVEFMYLYGSEAIPFLCTNSNGCSSCKEFTIKNLKPGRFIVMVVKFLKQAEIFTKIFATDFIYYSQSYEQTDVGQVRVKVYLFNPYQYTPSCSILLNTASASCNQCPTNCSDYTITFTKTDSFTATLKSIMGLLDDELTIKPVQYRIVYDISTLQDNGLFVRFIPNLLSGGICIIEAFNGDIKLNINCNLSHCNINCDNLTLVITGIPKNANLKIKISNRYLSEPAEFIIKQESITTVEHDIITTSVSAKVIVIGGGSCCCKAQIQYSWMIIYYDYCYYDLFCKNCSSFSITGLTPKTTYNLAFTTPNNGIINRPFVTKYLNVVIKPHISFYDADIRFIMDYKVLGGSCYYEVYDEFDYFYTCYPECGNCSFTSVSKLTPNTTYAVYYYNDYTKGSFTRTFKTLDVNSKFPAFLTAVQYDDSTIMVTIDNNSTYDYKGEYDIYAIQNESIHFHPDHSAPLDKGVITPDDKNINISIRIIYKLYLVQVCFDVYHNNCDKNPNMYYCLICSRKVIKVCDSNLLHNTSGTFALEKQQTLLSVSHTLEAIECHEELTCYIALIYLLRKNVTTKEMDHYPYKKYYFVNGMMVNYIAELNNSECRQNVISINTVNTYSGEMLINAKNVFYTVSFITCNSISCFPSIFYDTFFVVEQQFTEMILAVIFGFVSFVAFLVSMYFLYTYTPETISTEVTGILANKLASKGNDGDDVIPLAFADTA